MNVFMLGDFKSNTGPSNANKALYAAMRKKENVHYSKEKNKIFRIIEMFFQMIWSDVCIICSASEINYYVLKLSKILNKRVFMILHGSKPFEYLINGGCTNDIKYKKYVNYEKIMFEKVDKILCVSKMFSEDMKIMYPSYIDKIDYINNIVDIDNLMSVEKKKQVIISTGGGIRQKRNLVVAQAIEFLNKVGEDYKYIVIGNEGNDGENIKKYDFVTYYSSLPHEEVLHLMSEAALYVQNSEYDTFCLAVLEAFAAGASILISQNVGCKDVFGKIESEDMIENVDDVKEVAKKIYNLMKHPNHDRMISGFRREEISEQFVSSKISKLMREQ